MTAFRFFLIILIFLGVSMAWMILGASVTHRTHVATEDLDEQMDRLWGPSSPRQAAPFLVFKGEKKDEPWSPVAPVASRIEAHFDHEYRYKGLLWFSLFTVDFTGTYTVETPHGWAAPGEWRFVFPLPEGAKRYLESPRIELDGEAQPLTYSYDHDNALMVPIPGDGEPHVVTVAMRTRGRDRWQYDTPVMANRATWVRNFSLSVTTDFKDIDYPEGTVSPTSAAEPHGEGLRAAWEFGDLRASLSMGVEMPSRPKAGDIAARMSFFAPVSLFFFLTVLFTVAVLKKLGLHPMHYLFISAGFFAFHILMAYLADILTIQPVFWICAAVSVLLVVSYMRLVAGVKFAVVYVGLAQLVYLVGFSYAFFWEGHTGRAVVVGAIATLFVLMQATGRVKWNEVFARQAAPPVQMPAPPPAPQTEEDRPPG